MWMIPTLLLASLLIIQGIHVSAHRSMDVDVGLMFTLSVDKTETSVGKLLGISN